MVVPVRHLQHCLDYVGQVFCRCLFSWITLVRLRLAGARVGRGFVSTGWVRLRIHPKAHVTIGSNVRINSGYGSNFVGSGQRTCIYVGRDAHLCVGSDVGLSNSVLICTKQISIGDGCLIGGDCLILDSDLHALPIGSDGVRAAEVKIDSQVFLGARCMVLKGAHIPHGIVCGAGSVVRRSFAARAAAHSAR